MALGPYDTRVQSEVCLFGHYRDLRPARCKISDSVNRTPCIFIQMPELILDDFAETIPSATRRVGGNISASISLGMSRLARASGNLYTPSSLV